jgi:hypothetical protein
MASNFSDIVKYQRAQGRGVLGSLGSAVGQSTLQRMDPRNYLFNRKGAMASLFPGLKGYQAKTTSDKISSGGNSGGFSTGQVELITEKLDQVRTQSGLVAKNTLVLPSMARDFHLVKQNMIKLVKLQGGTPTTKSGDWFSRQMARESAYESKFGNRPTPVTKSQEKKEESFLSKLFGGGLSGIMSGFMSALIKGGLIVGALAAIGAAIKQFFTNKEFRDSVIKTVTDFFKSDFGKALMIGAGVVVAVFATFRLALLALEAVVLKIAARMAGAFGVPGPAGGAGGKGGKGGKGGNPASKGGGRLGWLTPLLLGLPFVNDMMGDDNNSNITETPGSSSVPGSTSSTTSQNSSGPNKMKIGVNAGIAGIAAYDAVTRVSSLSTPKVSGYNSSAGRFVNSSGKFVSAKDLPSGDMLRKFFDFASKAASKGWISRIGGKLAARLGIAVATKAVAFIGGLAVPGAGWLVSAASMAMLAYDAYIIYDAIFGANGILEELEKEDAIQASPSSQSETPSIPALATPPSSSPTTYNAARDSQAANSPLSTSVGGVDRVLNTIRGVESGGNYNAKNPNSTASGAYQFIDGTWQAATKQYGIGQEYSTARSAPPEIQDIVARKSVEDLLRKYNGDVDKVVNVWYTGNPEGKLTAAGLAANKGLTAEGYRARFASQYNGGTNLNKSSVAMADGKTNTSGTNPTVNNTQVAQAAPAFKPMEVPDLKVYDSDLAKFLLEPVVI